ncbi:hypothetical protein DY000_02031290 [Brassica cretica]|uniref:Arabidopsis retrotransposon Orf1 C-terminal domain-containing protein n=1 Tax=Brassica cretica TaxID=69181 RepID=A0ABQ7DVU1_BRACR|nr:hypothetical protein DY000_02031290 [Brassica cretica]
MLLDFNCEGWDKESAKWYNSLLNIEILPTRFGHADNLVSLGLDTVVFETLHAMGIAPLCYRTQELYLDLVRQVLATAHIGYDDPSKPTYENCSFSFMADGKFCSLSLDKLNEIYEISDERREVAVINKFTPIDRCWDLIANGSFTSRKVYQSKIRNPTLRIIAKMVSNLLFAKDQTSKVTKGELHMLYSGLEDEIRRARDIPIQPVYTNPGYHLIWMFYTRWDCLMRAENKSEGKKDRCGSLLTPLFKYFGIDLRSYAVTHEIEYIDTPYLIACHILCDEFTYKFADKEGNVLYCKLPQPHLTNFSTIENIRFLPDPEFLCADPRAPPPDDEMDEPEDITPDEDTVYDLGPLDDDADDAAYRRWMVDSRQKNNSLMKRILKAITGGCFGSQEARPSSHEQTPQQSHRPGKEPVGSSRAGEHLPRNRRTAGRSESGE